MAKKKEELVCSPVLNVLLWRFISVKVGLADIYLSLFHKYLHAYTPTLFIWFSLQVYMCVVVHIHKMDNIIITCEWKMMFFQFLK